MSKDHLVIDAHAHFEQPFAIAEQKPIQFIDSCDFDAAERLAILGSTAAALFRVALP